MDDAQRFQLIGGPYCMPHCRIGQRLRCRLRGPVEVAGISDTPIPWPQARRDRPSPIVCGDLVKALRRESATAICHWWGVTGQTVTKWRKLLGIRPGTPGTRRLRRAWAPEALTDDVRARAMETLRSPEYGAKVSARQKGKPPPQEVLDKAHAANRRRKVSAETRAKMSRSQRARGTYPPAAGRPFTPDEDAVLGTVPDHEAAAQQGRTVNTI
jgi:hypothetical protein